MPSKYTIKDLERLSGIKAHTLRIWEQRYSILKPDRTDTNIRLYSNDDLRRILNISMINNNGSKISKIAKMEEDTIAEEVDKIVNTYKNENNQIDGLILAMVEFDEQRFEKTVTNCIIHFGFEKTYENVLVPFLRQIGIMWRIGMINPAQEHFISNLIRQKLIVAIDSVDSKSVAEDKHVVLFLPDNELHEISLLYCYYLCKVQGLRCLYLGQTVPLDEILKISEVSNNTHFVCIITSKFEHTSAIEYLHALSEKIPNKTFFVSGAQVVLEEQALPNRFYKFSDSQEFRNLL
jgi:MerR family transcriptional regulator, light-induced transcriptional regulator